MALLSSDLSEFANHFYSDSQVKAAVDEFLLEHHLSLANFAQMTEREFVRLFEQDTSASLDFLRGLNHSRVIPGLMRRLHAEGIDLLPNQSVYFHSELRSSGGYNSAVHRILVRKDGALLPLCNRLHSRVKRWSVLSFGDLSHRRLCSLCAGFNLDREWHRL
jgi:hypothetical protein